MALSSITVSGITPDLAILGAYQRFIFPSTINSCTLGTKNTFVPTVSNDSITNLEMMNTGLNGFRWVHATTSAGTFGNLTFQSFIGATPTNIWGTGEGGAFTIYLPTIFSQNINMGAFKITNLGTPTAGTDAATKSYVDTAPNLPITLTGAVTGTGTSTIATSYNGTVGVTNGGTGITSTTAYAVICGGTTSTAPLQSVSGVGTAGQTLTSSGAGAVPTWATRAYANIIMISNATATAYVGTALLVGGTTTLVTVSTNLFSMPQNNRIRYDGTPAIVAKVDITLSFSDDAGGYCTFLLYKNGAVANTFSAPVDMNPGGAGSRGAVAISTIITMALNDYLEVFTTSTINPTNITVQHLNFTVNAL
jgi:hypothetical protein